ncbi:Oidioi.mRNA.OKI2018_I69.chr2.g5271.t1.cds [Oikopleura dioica]|uniref:Oidioi.mRNA.OKI2018_I69.chr2.g5271.t1.cds n=1 Tax=Oikopleura dioica TaxID=34765 RepID=A0ABN7T478_OIKDI|nr:Oidioi.mRNA.OKI2018_I69.chr2.g5271.t1.cds [Oikopleura dioica]
MGLFLSRLKEAMEEWNILGAGRSAKVAMIGLDNAGKTTILYKLKLQETVSSVPTIGFNVETLDIAPGLEMTVWDIGGQDVIRPLWRHYYQNLDGIIWIVDSQDHERFDQSFQEFQNVLNDENLPRGDLPILIFANKQDLPGAAAPEKITRQFGLLNMRRENWHVQGSNAVNGDGLIEGMDIFAKMVKDHVKNSRH